MWEPKYPIKFTSDGDFTRQAIAKHINEILAIYGHLNALRRFSVSVVPPADAEDYDAWLDPSTMELKTYFRDQGWVCVIRVQNAVASDVSNSSKSSQNSDRLGGHVASYYATEAGLRELQALVEEALLNPPDSRMPVFKGEWRDGGGYEPYDVVEYLGSSYILLEGDGLIPPPTEPYWQLIAKAGRDFFMSQLHGGHADTAFTVFVSGGAA